MKKRQEEINQKSKRFVKISDKLLDLMMNSNVIRRSNKGRGGHLLGAHTKKRKRSERGPTQYFKPLFSMSEAAQADDGRATKKIRGNDKAFADPNDQVIIKS